jgi:hypothetical protein
MKQVNKSGAILDTERGRDAAIFAIPEEMLEEMIPKQLNR